MAVTLGKDCTIQVGGAVAGVRSVTLAATAKTIDVDPFGSRDSVVYSIGWDATATIELNDSEDVGALLSKLQSGEELTITGGVLGWTFPAVIVSLSESEPIDGVVSYTVEARLTGTGLRS